MDKPNLYEIKCDSDVKATIEDSLAIASRDDWEAVMVVGLRRKDGAQFLRTSTASGYQKAFMVQFASAWLNSWFGIEHV